MVVVVLGGRLFKINAKPALTKFKQSLATTVKNKILPNTEFHLTLHGGHSQPHESALRK